jgi:L-lactate dehydrogenase complex protein LldF
MENPHRWRRALRLLRLGRLVRRGRLLPPPLSAWTATRDLPRPPQEPLREWWLREGRR